MTTSATTESFEDGTAAVLARLTRPYDAARTAAALLGLPLHAGRQLVGLSVATSAEAERCLRAVPRIMRSMTVATTDRPRRCHGEIRGPVLWSETISARAATAGDPGLFVCATTERAYDTDENRVLKAALALIDRAGHDAVHGVDPDADPAIRQAWHNHLEARRLLEHQTLAGVPLVRITGRNLTRTRAGGRRMSYAPAVAVLRRAEHPLDHALLSAYATHSLRQEHDVLAAALRALDARSASTVPLHTARGALVAGPIRYVHPEGVSVGGVTVASTDQIDDALDRALPA